MTAKSSTILAFFIVSLLFLSFLTIHVSAFEGSVTETVNLSPIADAYVDSYYPDENTGNAFYLWIRNTRYGASSLIFIKFDLSSIRTDAAIVSAQLKLHGGPLSNGGDVSAYYVCDDSWRELGLTYDNRPNISNTLTCTVEDISSYGSWYSWDITEDAIDAFHDDKILAEVLIWGNTTEYGGIYFNSRESGWPPKLEIIYASPTSPTTTPPITPTPTLPSTPAPWWEEQLWWIIIGTVGTIVILFLKLYGLYRDRRKP